MDIKKEDFIKLLSSLSPQDTNRLIEERGKERKLVNPFIIKQNDSTKVDK